MQFVRFAPIFALFVLTACPGDPYNPPRPDGGTPQTDGELPGDDSGVPPPDGGMQQMDGDVVVGCNNPLTPPASGTCELIAGSANILITADLIVPSGVLENGELLISSTGAIICADCDCSSHPEANNATLINCANGVVSPALINAHDHITFTEAPPAPHTDKYAHRHQWRRGQDGLDEIPSVSNRGGDRGVWWGELRNLLAGATVINGSGGAAGLLRNIDQPAELQEGLNQARVRYSTFPLKDSGGLRLTSGCDYDPQLDDPDSPAIAQAAAYTPHISEGIDLSARNEYLCLSQDTEGSPDEDVIFNKTAVIHGIGLLAADFRDMAASRASLIWSPRSNIDLYGDTAQVILAKNAGVRTAIGSDWAISGSMNILRELHCADEFNERNLNGALSDRELIDMATVNAAGALGAGEKLGALAPGLEADITIWNGATNTGYRAILDADPEDVVLVLRSGRALYGDRPLMSALPDTGGECETLDVCSVEKSVCARRETGSTIADMRAAIATNSYPLFFCGTPMNEPTCIPSRAEYNGMPMAGDMDGDGVADAMDNCPAIFNPARPLDMGVQANHDNDDDGDACDVCPTDANTTTCMRPDPADIDADGVLDTMDNCRGVANPDQMDRDTDGKGDVCDECPNENNPGSQGCSATIYQIKQQEVTGRVTVRNALVTVVAPNGFFVQIVEGDADYDMTLRARFSGLFVFVGTSAMKPAPGDRVDVTGVASDFFGQQQVDASTTMMGSFTVLSSGNPLPAPVMVAASDVGTTLDMVDGPLAEAFEGVFLEVGSATVTSIDPPPDPAERTPTNEFMINNALRVDDYIYLATPFPSLGETFTYVRGVLRYSFNAYELDPRSALDLGTRERLASITPSYVYVPRGTMSEVPVGGFAATMSRPVSMPINVSLVSSSTTVIVPSQVTVAGGATSADIPVTAPLDARLGPATITASYDGDTAIGTVYVYDDDAPRTFDGFDVTPAQLPVSSEAIGTIELSLPGRRITGTTVALEVSPAGIVFLDEPEVIVPAGARSVTFSVFSMTAEGTATITARVDGSEETFDVTVYTPTSRSPGPGDLLITEVFRNPNGADEKLREWFEVVNTTNVDIIVDGITVADAVRSQIVSAPGQTIPPGGHAVFAYSIDPATNGGVTAIAAYGAADIQLNNGDETIRLSYGGMTVDELVYAMGWPGAGQGVAMCLRVPYPMDNGVSSAWSNSVGTFGTVSTEQGSPNVPSDSTNCP